MITANPVSLAESVPTPTLTVPAEQVTPGFAGFAIIVVLVLAVFLLVWDMQRRIRRARYRGEVNEQLDQEEAAAAVAATDADDQALDADTAVEQDAPADAAPDTESK